MNNLITLEKGVPCLTQEAEQLLIASNQALELAKEHDKELRDELFSLMKDNGYKSIKTDKVIITVKAGGTRESFDKKTFQAENPDLYDKYVALSPVAESLMIKYAVK